MIALSRGVGFETVQTQSPSGVDGQGKPTYAAVVAIKARVVREDKTVRKPDGSEIVSVATIWIDVGQPALPLEQWRLTLVEGLVGIVVERMEGRNLSKGALDHVRLRMRRE